MIKKSIITVLLLVCLTSCKKEKEMRSVSGYLYRNCQQEAIVGLHLSVIGVRERAFQYAEETYIGEVTTDNNGFYSLSYETDKYFDRLSFLDKNNKAFLKTGYENEMNMVHYESAIVNHNIILNVEDTLSQFDTLYLVPSMNSPILLTTGPFKDGQIIPIQIRPNIGTTFSLLISNDRVGKGLFIWGLGKAGINRPTQGQTGDPQTIRGTLQPVCGQGEDIIIDLSIVANE